MVDLDLVPPHAVDALAVHCRVEKKLNLTFPNGRVFSLVYVITSFFRWISALLAQVLIGHLIGLRQFLSFTILWSCKNSAVQYLPSQPVQQFYWCIFGSTFEHFFPRFCYDKNQRKNTNPFGNIKFCSFQPYLQVEATVEDSRAPDLFYLFTELHLKHIQ